MARITAICSQDVDKRPWHKGLEPVVKHPVFNVYRRVIGGEDAYRFVERAAKPRITRDGDEYPMVYSFSPASGKLNVEALHLEAAIEVAVEHMDKYAPASTKTKCGAKTATRTKKR